MPRLTEEQLARRRNGLGATDVVAIAGLSKYRTPHDVYLEKVEGKTQEVSERVEEAGDWGHNLEPVIAQEFARRRGIKFSDLKPGASISIGPLFWATPDYVLDYAYLLECKSRSFFAGKEWGPSGDPSGVPADVVAQVQWQMMATGHDTAWVAVLIGGNDYREYEIKADKQEQERLLQLAENFWENHVLVQNPPPLTADENADLRELSGDYFQAGKYTADLCNTLEALEQEQRNIEERISEIKSELQNKIGENIGLVAPGWKITWMPVKGRVSVQWERLAHKLGATAQQIQEHQVEGKGYRRFKMTRTTNVEV